MEKLVVADIVSLLNEVIPFAYQESYDNSGLQTGNPLTEVDSAILSVDVTEEVVEEAVRTGAGFSSFSEASPIKISDFIPTAKQKNDIKF